LLHETSTETVVLRLPAFAESEEEAVRRFDQTRGADPFPDIHPALLNTADLVDYIAATGMVYPFKVNPANASEMLKPASCGIPLGGTVVFWDTDSDGSPKKTTRDLLPGEELQLKRNSIVYVTLEPMLRMPDYMAARFNLTIRDIYRGVLVGTGPLIDPGFTGHISLPLHNLTFNDYIIKGGEPLVWMEFTKLSTNKQWASGQSHARKGEYVPFPERKRNRRTVEDYVNYASAIPITSSIPRLVGQAEASAQTAQRQVQRQVRIFGGVSLLALLAVVAGIATMLVSVYGLVDSSNASRRDLVQQVDVLEHQIEDLRQSQKKR
jgi:deoxycytidine triphosphate deaminase